MQTDRKWKDSSLLGNFSRRGSERGQWRGNTNPEDQAPPGGKALATIFLLLNKDVL